MLGPFRSLKVFINYLSIKQKRVPFVRFPFFLSRENSRQGGTTIQMWKSDPALLWNVGLVYRTHAGRDSKRTKREVGEPKKKRKKKSKEKKRIKMKRGKSKLKLDEWMEKEGQWSRWQSYMSWIGGPISSLCSHIWSERRAGMNELEKSVAMSMLPPDKNDKNQRTHTHAHTNRYKNK